MTSFLVDAEIPTRLMEWLTATVKSPALFLLLLNAVLLVLGSVLEIYSAIVVLAPLLAPLGARLRDRPHPPRRRLPREPRAGLPLPADGAQPLPLGVALREAAPQVYRNAFPFLIIMSAGVLAITYLPILTTGVVQLFGR